MKSLLFIGVFIFSSQILYSQDTAGYRRLSVVKSLEETGPITPLDSSFFNAFNSLDPGLMWIDLMEGFDDSVEIYVNGKLYASGYYITNSSIDHASSLCVSFSDHCTIRFLMLFRNARQYILEDLRPGFKHLEIRGFKEWNFYYSNHFYLAE